jgi:uncharacterized protein
LAQEAPRPISLQTARRVAVMRQRLAGPRPAPNAEGIMDVVRDLRCLQLDPTSIVARTHLLVLWSRLGPYDRAELDALLWDRKELFEYWAHAASIVLTEDYPIHQWLMRKYGVRTNKEYRRRLKEWVKENDRLRRYILRRLRAEGPLRTRDLEDISAAGWTSTGWTNQRNVDRMLDYLWTKGKIVIVGRPGGQKLWNLGRRMAARVDAQGGVA